VIPHPGSEASIARKYRELLRKSYPNEDPNFGSEEGYIDAVILVEGLRRAGRDLTTDTLVDALETISGLDLGLGTPLRFGPSMHQASHKVWGTVLDSSGHYRILELE
jgi:eukaryotic-like serine/threonine-protein kinase